MLHKKLLLECGDFEIEIFDEGCLYVPGSTDNVRHYRTVHDLDDVGESSSSAHGVVVSREAIILGSTLFLAGSGSSGIHERSALITGLRQLLLAIGPHILCLSLPELHLQWATPSDDATCFGIHSIPSSRDVISHGELEIARLDCSGSILWRAGGADIFTGTLTVHADHVEVYDFANRHYLFDLESGEPFETREFR